MRVGSQASYLPSHPPAPTEFCMCACLPRAGGAPAEGGEEGAEGEGGKKDKKGKPVKESAIAKKLREQLEARKRAEEEAAR